MERQIRALIQQNQIMKRRIDNLEDLLVGGGFGGLDPVVDPSPVDTGRGGLGPRVPGGLSPVADPAPEDLFNVRLIDLIRKFRGGVVDPAPEDFVNVRIKDLINIIPGGGVVDPAPEDLARLDKAQLETRLTEIDIARKRLDQLQGMITDQLKRG